MKIRIISLIVSLYFLSIQPNPRKAICTAPVLDVVEYALGGYSDDGELIKQAYKNIPFSWGPSEQDRSICPRIYQLLLHETVTILDETAHEAYVQIDSCFVYDRDTKRSLTGWVLKEHLKNLDEIELKKIPAPLSWTNSNIDRANIKTVTLFTSFTDTAHTIYCAGTRFILNKMINDAFEVYAYNAVTDSFKLIEIPQTSCVYETYYFTPQEKLQHFCHLLEIWTSIPDHCIPLVWGGASIGTVCSNGNFNLQSYTSDAGESRYGWTRPAKPVADVYTGVDASSVILRAAHIFGIPYFCRNSKTAAQSLLTLAPYEYPQTGDIMWLPGSLLVINNLSKNTIITAMSYTSGYGALIELPLHKVFKGITNYYQLSQAYKNSQPLTLLNKDGSEARTINEFKILRMNV